MNFRYILMKISARLFTVRKVFSERQLQVHAQLDNVGEPFANIAKGSLYHSADITYCDEVSNFDLS